MVVYTPNRSGGISANPAGSEMNVRTTGSTRPIRTAFWPCRANHRSARSMSCSRSHTRRPQRRSAAWPAYRPTAQAM